jgi:RHS repeat-associated protein
VNGDTLNSPVVRYQLGNHLGSASLELDRDGALISYEEYHPYGTTAFQAGRSAAEVSLKRYRYTGMERDEETGLNYHGARYYAGWLGRWCSCDPKDTRQNLYEYVSNNPVRLYDPNGRDGETPPASKGFLGHAKDFATGLYLGGKDTVVGVKDLLVLSMFL